MLVAGMAGVRNPADGRWRGGRRRPFIAAAVALLVLAGSLSMFAEEVDAQSQTDRVLLSNTNQTRTLYEEFPPRAYLLQQKFQTGLAPNPGWNLSHVTIGFDRVNTFMTITILEDNNGTPGAVRHTLNIDGNTRPRILEIHTDDNLFTFDAPEGATLESDTTYWIRITPSHGSRYRVAPVGLQDEASLSGWRFIGRLKKINHTTNVPVVGSMVVEIVGHMPPVPPSRTEHTAADLPWSDETYGFVDVGNTSFGTMDPTLDSGRRVGDWWKLHVEPHRRYRVQVSFGSGGPNAGMGGGINVNGRAELWDHMRDDGLAFVEFTAQRWEFTAQRERSRRSYHVRVRARDFLNSGSQEYYGAYQINLYDITHISEKVSNGLAYSGSKTGVGDESSGVYQVGVNHWLATPFTAGSNSGGYNFEYVGSGLHDAAGVSQVSAALYTDSSGDPGTKIFDLRRISQITGQPTAQYSDRFWAPLGVDATLTADTTYWVVFRDEAAPGTAYLVPFTNSGADNPYAASGWSIGDSTKYYNAAAATSTWTERSNTKSIVLDVYASNVATGNASEAVDQAAPRLQSATVDGGTLTLVYDKVLDVTATPPFNAFSVNVNGSPRSIMVVAVGQTNLLLYLSTPVEAGDAVTVDYTVPTGESEGRVQDQSGNAAESFSGQAVTNDGGARSDEGDPPGVPSNLKVALQQSGRLKATWEAPGPGPAPTGYTVQWMVSGDDWEDPGEVSETDVTKTSYVIGGLTDGVEYSVRVVATKDDADGDPSEEVTATPQETTPPGLSSTAVDGAELTLTFDEPLDAGMVPDRSAFVVTVAGGGRGVETVTASGGTVTLALVTAVFAGDAVTVDYTAPAGEQSDRLRDQVGNAAASFSGQSVTNDTNAADQLTAVTPDVPAGHDGNATFTFELRFSETPRKGFSYRTIRDHAFTVTGGDLVKANRLVKGKNVRWQIHVRPDGNGAVNIVLPVTTDCASDGAICTQDRRPLSNRLELTVPGPGMPEITSGTSFTVSEGAKSVATLTATDEDTQAADLTWSISGGTDRAYFTLTTAGILAFAASKDYETPDDADGDGVYQATVQVSDGERTDTADLTVTLTNVNEAPTADAGSDQEDVAEGSTVTLSGSGADPDDGEVLSYAWSQTGTSTVSLSDAAAASPNFTTPTGLTADTALTFTLRVTDDEGLYAEDSVTVTISVQSALPPMTASIHDVPAAHDGSSSFTFELRFSETPRKGFSYRTLRDHAFTVTRGDVVHVRRLERGKNIRWEITVRPNSNGAVTVVLPVTEDCEADGAICTEDGRMLSNRLEITVSGPGG